MDVTATGQEIYARIKKYCDVRKGPKGIGGECGQEPYKGDFFRIFVDAYEAGLCGKAASHADQINGQRIGDRLYQGWLPPNDSSEAKRMVDTLTEWWDAWTYALDEYKRSEG